jgi:hypothetical protein
MWQLNISNLTGSTDFCVGCMLRNFWSTLSWSDSCRE